MATLPQLIEEDIRQLDDALAEFIRQAGAIGALIIDKGGFLITHKGDMGELDLTTIGALASGAFMASQTIAGLVEKRGFAAPAITVVGDVVRFGSERRVEVGALHHGLRMPSLPMTVL